MVNEEVVIELEPRARLPLRVRPEEKVQLEEIVSA